jgi:hypothetical protein
VALGWSTDALVARALGVVVPESALLGLVTGVRPLADAVGVGVGDGVGPAFAGVGGVVEAGEAGVDELDARRVGMAVGEALADGDGAVPSRLGDGTGRGRVVGPAGPTGVTGC